MKRTLTGIAAASIVLGAMAPAAFASTVASTVGGRKAIAVNGKIVSQPFTRVALDAGNPTSYIGIWYLGQAIKAAGGDWSWDPSTKTFAITVPGVDGATVAAEIPNGVGTGNSTITVNGVVVKKVNSFAAQDPAGGKNDITTFMPIFYLGEIFGELGGNASWDGNTFSFKTFAGVNVSAANSSVTTFPTSLTDGQAYTVNVTLKDAAGNAITSVPNNFFKLTVGKNAPITGTAVNLGNGNYAVVFVPKTLTVGQNQVATLSAGDTTIGAQFVTVSAGNVGQETSSASFPTVSVLNEGATYTINVSPKDANGNPATLSGTANIYLGTGSQAVALATNVPVGSPTNGVYSFTFTAPNVAISTPAPLQIVVDGLTFTSTTNYTVAAQTVSSLRADFSGLPSTLNQQGSYTIPVTLLDANNNPVVGANLASFQVSYAGQTLTSSAAPTSTPGVYNVTFTMPTASGLIVPGTVSTIKVSYNGTNASQVSPATYTLGSTTALGAVNSVTVTWPSNSTLVAGQPYTVTVTVKDANGNGVTGLGAANFAVQEGPFNAGLNNVGVQTGVTAGSTPGTYTVTFTPTAPATTQTYELAIGSAGSWTQYGTSDSVNVQGTPSGVTLPAALTNGVLVAGQSVTIPVTVSGGATNLTTSDFAVSYNGQLLPVTAVKYISGSTYDVTFTAPSTTNSTGATLSVDVDGNVASATGVTVAALNAITPVLTVAAQTGGASTVTANGVTYSEPASANLSMNTSYFTDTITVTSGGHDVFGIPQSAVTAAFGSGNATPATVVAFVPDTTTAGQYDLVINSGSTALSGQNLYVTLNGVSSADSGAWNVKVGQPVLWNSAFTYPTGNLAHQLTQGTAYTISVTLKDAKGNPVTGLQSYNFAVGTAASSSGPLTADFSGTWTVSAGSTPGTYTITITPGSADATPKYLGVVVDPAATSGSPATFNDSNPTAMVSVSDTATTVK